MDTAYRRWVHDICRCGWLLFLGQKSRERCLIHRPPICPLPVLPPPPPSGLTLPQFRTIEEKVPLALKGNGWGMAGSVGVHAVPAEGPAGLRGANREREEGGVGPALLRAADADQLQRVLVPVVARRLRASGRNCGRPHSPEEKVGRKQEKSGGMFARPRWR